MQYTTNLSLPLFETGDRVDLMTSYNAAMRILDQYVYGLPTDAAVQQAIAAASAAQATANAAQATANAAASKADAIEDDLTRSVDSVSVGDLSSAILTDGGYFAIPEQQPANEPAGE